MSGVYVLHTPKGLSGGSRGTLSVYSLRGELELAAEATNLMFFTLRSWKTQSMVVQKWKAGCSENEFPVTEGIQA